MRKLSVLLALVAGLFISEAKADFTAKNAGTTTITFKNPGDCTSVVCVPVFQIYDGTNVVTLTTAGADAVSNTLTGVPMYGRNLVFNGTTWDRWLGDATNGGFVNVKTSVLPTGAATSAAQTTAQTSLTTIATNSALPLPAQTGIGNVNIGAVQNAGSKYIAVAASATATVLQASAGAAGDYLSHCVLYPTSTSPGVVTVFDNTNTAATSAILFPGGASSTSNLTPISVPVGAVSTAGAWKVTTGANVSVVCYGKFS